jgi:hypothetical protein
MKWRTIATVAVRGSRAETSGQIPYPSSVPASDRDTTACSCMAEIGKNVVVAIIHPTIVWGEIEGYLNI